ncbi:hypothetical protein NDU88_004162 [Pleurodeles waltl]|uniref:Uncharacterized protein n=1 Tax=Pleurodeles waltl TaxID=8319 RepID=A0AAV7W9J8_PLEWA|nr:hypothetical protein NDU88_004162 [Pleurodeles waltl]
MLPQRGTRNPACRLLRSARAVRAQTAALPGPSVCQAQSPDYMYLLLRGITGERSSREERRPPGKLRTRTTPRTVPNPKETWACLRRNPVSKHRLRMFEGHV